MAIKATLNEQLDEAQTKLAQSYWLPANSGTEEPFTTRTGHRVQYMYQPMTGNHAYLCLDTDIFIADDELGLFGLGPS